MAHNNIKIGKLGEDIACEYLVENGYKILFRNYRKNWGEIDIIGREKDGTLVFFEIKTLNGAFVKDLTPEDNMTFSKLQKLKKICSYFANKNKNLIKSKGWRIDLIAVSIKTFGNCEDNIQENNSLLGKYSARHYKNIIS